MSSETERLAELVTDLGQRFADAFGDVVSPEAKRHLRNAQREALTALFLIYEEQMGRRAGRGRRDDDEGWPMDLEGVLGEGDDGGDGDAPPPRPERRRARPRRTPAKPAARPSRVTKIDLD